MIKNNDENSIIYIEQLVAGALLKFPSLDALDIHLLGYEFNDFIKKQYELFSYFKFVELKDIIDWTYTDVIKLKENLSLNSYLEQYGCSVSTKLKIIAGETVLLFFDSFDILSFKDKRERVFFKQKEKVLKSANVLMISNHQELLNQLYQYGFTKIDCFDSLTTAERYFMIHEELLEKYHIILIDNQGYEPNRLNPHSKLTKKIYSVESNSLVALFNTNCQKVKYDISLYDSFVMREWTNDNSTYQLFLDKIITGTIIGRTLERIDLKYQDCIPIRSKNYGDIHLPKTKKDLKIAYLGKSILNNYVREITQNLELHVDVYDGDNSNHIDQSLFHNLPQYDIVIIGEHIASSFYELLKSDYLSNQDNNLQLFMITKVTHLHSEFKDCDFDFYDIGDDVILKYFFLGTLTSSLKADVINYRLLYEDDNVFQNMCQKKALRIKKTIRSILNQSVLTYNDALIKTDNHQLLDINERPKKVTDLNEENIYDIDEQQNLNAIATFDYMRSIIISYLNHRKNGSVTDDFLNEINIHESQRHISIQNICNGRAIFAINIPKSDQRPNLKIFSIQTINKKGELNDPKLVGLYTTKYDKIKNLPKRPNPKQMQLINALFKKINCTLNIANEHAMKFEISKDFSNKIYKKKYFPSID